MTSSARVLAHAASGYHAAAPVAAQAPLHALRFDLDSAGTRHATVTLAREAAALPVVVLLPALGEDDGSAQRWADSIARAGYAVVRVQPLEEDALAWRSDRARNGAFAVIARERFDPALLPSRLAALAADLARLRAQPNLATTLDWTRLAYAGVDLGAFTVQAIAAGQGVDLPPASALIVLGPFGSPVEGASAAHPPLLMASGVGDFDPYGFLTREAQRHAAFDSLGPGVAAYLELDDLTRGLLLGQDIEEPALPDTRQDLRPSGAEQSPNRRQRPESRPAAPPGEEAPDAEDLRQAEDEAKAREARLKNRFQEGRNRAERMALARISVETVVVAFLDARLRSNPAAAAWLGGGALPAWLGRDGRIQWRGKGKDGA